MKINIKDKTFAYDFILKNTNIIYTNDNLNIIITNIKKAFEGKIYLEINGNEYKKSHYNYLWFDEYFNIKDSEKFNSKSIEYNFIEQKIQLSDFDYNLSDIKLNLQNLLNTFTTHLKIDNKKINTLDLVPLLFKLSYDENNLSNEMFRFLLLVDIYLDKTEETLIFFENTYYYNNKLFKQLLDLLTIKRPNIKIIFFTNKISIFKYLSFNILFFKTNKLYNLNIQNVFKKIYLMKELQKNEFEIIDYYNFIDDIDLQTHYKNLITISSWENFFHEKPLNSFEQLFFNLLTENSLNNDQEYYELKNTYY